MKFLFEVKKMKGKVCFKCGEFKLILEFYKHSAMGDGYLNKCKSCTRSDTIKNRLDKIDYYREYDRDRAALPHRVEASVKNTRVARGRNPLYGIAHIAVRREVRRGNLMKQPCEKCGSNEWIHAHHDDYTKPLDVKWLCAAHHKERHKELGW
jgi:hypothetical protein